LRFVHRTKRLGRSRHIALGFDPDDLRERARSPSRIHHARGVEPSAIEGGDRPVLDDERFFGRRARDLLAIEDGDQARALKKGLFRRGFGGAAWLEGAIDFEAIHDEAVGGQRLDVRTRQDEPDHIAVLLKAQPVQAGGRRTQRGKRGADPPTGEGESPCDGQHENAKHQDRSTSPEDATAPPHRM